MAVKRRWLLAAAACLLALAAPPAAGEPQHDHLLLTGVREAAVASRGDRELLARFISGEAGRESYEAQVAVGAVVLNRLAAPGFPKAVVSVVFQPGAFESVTRGGIYSPVCASCWLAAADAAAGWDPTAGALYFFDPAAVRHPFFLHRPVARQVGHLVFTR